METQNTTKKDYSIPVAIIIAGIFIAGAVFYSSPQISNNVANNYGAGKNERRGVVQEPANTATGNVKPVSVDDHIKGNPDAPVKIVEFSDTECPFCKRFHNTMNQIMESELGKSGNVAWVYRHFPLDQLHAKARKEAQATECATELGGNDGFWKYTDRIFEITPANDGLDLALLPEIAEYVGLNKTEFEKCLSSDKYTDKIESQVQDAVASGGRGTPYSIAIAQNGEKFVINGAESYEFVKATIERALKEK